MAISVSRVCGVLSSNALQSMGGPTAMQTALACLAHDIQQGVARWFLRRLAIPGTISGGACVAGGEDLYGASILGREAPQW
jgi:hypothetical protein